MPAIRQRCANEWLVTFSDVTHLEAAFEALREGAASRNGKTVDAVKMQGSHVRVRFAQRVTFSAAHDWVKRKIPVPVGKKRKQNENGNKHFSLKDPGEYAVEVKSSPHRHPPLATCSSPSAVGRWLVQKMLFLHVEPDRVSTTPWQLNGPSGSAGSGAFGSVSLGLLDGKQVAVKTLMLGTYE